MDSFKAFASEVNHSVNSIFKHKSNMFEIKHEVKLGIIDFDEINEESLERIKKQFDLLVAEYKNRDNSAI